MKVLKRHLRCKTDIHRLETHRNIEVNRKIIYQIWLLDPDKFIKRFLHSGLSIYPT